MPMLPGLLLLVFAASSCGEPTGAPDRPADVTGVVAQSQAGEFVLAAPSNEYYDGMALLRGDPVVISDGDDQPIAASELVGGDGVEVWISDGCAESFPVQCNIAALRVKK